MQPHHVAIAFSKSACCDMASLTLQLKERILIA